MPTITSPLPTTIIHSIYTQDTSRACPSIHTSIEGQDSTWNLTGPKKIDRSCRNRKLPKWKRILKRPKVSASAWGPPEVYCNPSRALTGCFCQLRGAPVAAPQPSFCSYLVCLWFEVSGVQGTEVRLRVWVPDLAIPAALSWKPCRRALQHADLPICT